MEPCIIDISNNHLQQKRISSSSITLSFNTLPCFARPEYGEILSLCIRSECGKIRTRKTPNTDTFYTAPANDLGKVPWTPLHVMQTIIQSITFDN